MNWTLWRCSLFSYNNHFRNFFLWRKNYPAFLVQKAFGLKNNNNLQGGDLRNVCGRCDLIISYFIANILILLRPERVKPLYFYIYGNQGSFIDNLCLTLYWFTIRFFYQWYIKFNSKKAIGKRFFIISQIITNGPYKRPLPFEVNS